MKVIKKGDLRVVFNCGECKAVLMASDKDIFTRTFDASSGGEIGICCNCPECGTQHRFQNSDLSPEQRDSILNRPPTPRSK